MGTMIQDLRLAVRMLVKNPGFTLVAMLTLARRIGIDVPEIALIDLESIANLPDGIGDLRGQAFAIARFDRAPDGPVQAATKSPPVELLHVPDADQKLASPKVAAAIADWIKKLAL